jgi:putative isomerase
MAALQGRWDRGSDADRCAGEVCIATDTGFLADYLWNRPGAVTKRASSMEARGASRTVEIYCVASRSEAVDGTCDDAAYISVPVRSPYFAVDFRGPVGVSTGKRRTIAEIQSAIEAQRQAYEDSVAKAGKSAPIVDAIETTIGWNTNYEPEGGRVITPVSRGWSTGWGGYVLFDWDTFFAASLAAVGSRDLAYANAVEILRSETGAGFTAQLCARRWMEEQRSLGASGGRDYGARAV